LYKIILLTDTHFTEGTSFEDNFNYFRSIYEEASSSKFNLVIHLGDLFDRSDRISSYIFTSVVRLIKSFEFLYKLPTIILAGNHDIKFSDSSNLEKNAITVIDTPVANSSLGLTTTKVLYKPVSLLINKHKFLLIPYNKDSSKIVDFINKEVSHQTSNCFLLGHFGLLGSGFGDLTPDDIHSSEFTRIILGHIHIRSFPTQNIEYMGSLFQHDFRDERSTPGYYKLLLDFSTPSYKLEFVENIHTKRFCTIDARTKEEFENFLVNYKKGMYSDKFVRVRYQSDLSMVTTNFESVPNFLTINPERRDTDKFEQIFEYDTLIRKYVEKRYKGNLSRSGIIKLGHKLIGGE